MAVFKRPAGGPFNCEKSLTSMVTNGVKTRRLASIFAYTDKFHMCNKDGCQKFTHFQQHATFLCLTE